MQPSRNPQEQLIDQDPRAFPFFQKVNTPTSSTLGTVTVHVNQSLSPSLVESDLRKSMGNDAIRLPIIANHMTRCDKFIRTVDGEIGKRGDWLIWVVDQVITFPCFRRSLRQLRRDMLALIFIKRVTHFFRINMNDSGPAGWQSHDPVNLLFGLLQFFYI